MKLHFLFAALVAALLLSSCFEPVKGCLDIEATNFDASADNDCCCKYPQLVLSIDNAYDTLVWKPDTAYQNNLGQWFRIRNIVFYLSDMSLTQNGTALQVSDTVNLFHYPSPTSGDTVQSSYTDDFLLVRRVPTTRYEVGTFRPSGNFQQVKMRFGVNDDAQLVVPNKAPAGHPLANQGENLYGGRDTAYVFARVLFNRDTSAGSPTDTLLLNRFDVGAFFIVQNGVFFHESGYDFNLRLRADWKTLFNDVDMTNGDNTATKAQMVNNLPAVFNIYQ